MMADDPLKRALDTLSARLHADIDRQVRGAADALSKATLPSGDRPALASYSDSGAGERLVAAIQAIAQARSLTEILEALFTQIGVEAQRVAVFLVRGDRLTSWRLAGFDGSAHASGEPAPVIDIAVDDAGILAAAVRGNTAVADMTGDGAPPFAVPPAEGLAVPIALSGEVVAVLYADHGATESWRETSEILVRYGARCLEVLTAFKVARSVAQPQPETAETSAADQDGSAEAESAARRYARLLVSEIKLYHEAEVVSGRQERDLATRLGGEIARARSLYEQRVPLPVRQRVDFFHDELVRTLANGDASLLAAGD